MAATLLASHGVGQRKVDLTPGIPSRLWGWGRLDAYSLESCGTPAEEERAGNETSAQELHGEGKGEGGGHHEAGEGESAEGVT